MTEPLKPTPEEIEKAMDHLGDAERLEWALAEQANPRRLPYRAKMALNILASNYRAKVEELAKAKSEALESNKAWCDRWKNATASERKLRGALSALSKVITENRVNLERVEAAEAERDEARAEVAMGQVPDDQEDEDNRCGHGVWKGDECWLCEKEKPDAYRAKVEELATVHKENEGLLLEVAANKYVQGMVEKAEAESAALRKHLDACHLAVGESPGSDDKTLAEGIALRLKELRAELAFLKPRPITGSGGGTGTKGEAVKKSGYSTMNCLAIAMNNNPCAKPAGHRGKHECHWGPGCCEFLANPVTYKKSENK
jgi:DNA repair exonuclease SbcCD ATPase subunit